MSKTNKELLASFKKSNKQRRERIAQLNGYSSADEYRRYLESNLGVASKTVTTETTTKPIIHVVDVLDCSGSMDWSRKIQSAMDGINAGIIGLRNNNDVVYKYSLFTFNLNTSIYFRIRRQSPENTNRVNFRATGGTALYDALGTAIEEFRKDANNGHKVLINVYTDGEENSSIDYTTRTISNLIESVSDIMTITFIGTEQDTKYVINNLKINSTNTLSYNGTGKGLVDSINQTISARTTYATKVVAGEDVRTGFYKEVVNK